MAAPPAADAAVGAAAAAAVGAAAAGADVAAAPAAGALVGALVVAALPQAATKALKPAAEVILRNLRRDTLRVVICFPPLYEKGFNLSDSRWFYDRIAAKKMTAA